MPSLGRVADAEYDPRVARQLRGTPLPQPALHDVTVARRERLEVVEHLTGIDQL